jgi:hypothetical protein
MVKNSKKKGIIGNYLKKKTNYLNTFDNNK